MTFVRALRDDLVERRLWPVAALLLVALVAIPVLMTRGGEAAPAPAPLPVTGASTAPAPAGASQPVALKAPERQTPRGPARDPFAGHGAAKARAATATAPVAVTTVTPEDPAPIAAGGPSNPSDSPVSPPTAAAPAPAAARTGPSNPSDERVSPPSGGEPEGHAAGYAVDLAWGPAGETRTVRDPARLRPLSAEDVPGVVFMGVRPDGGTVLFLLLGEAKGAGDGRCRPTPALCHLVELRAGDTEYVDVPGADGIRQYELRVETVDERRTDRAPAAARRRARVSEAGRALLVAAKRDGRAFAGRYVYVPARGVLRFDTGQ